jgi:hypothetical protein
MEVKSRAGGNIRAGLLALDSVPGSSSPRASVRVTDDPGRSSGSRRHRRRAPYCGRPANSAAAGSRRRTRRTGSRHRMVVTRWSLASTGRSRTFCRGNGSSRRRSLSRPLLGGLVDDPDQPGAWRISPFRHGRRGRRHGDHERQRVLERVGAIVGLARLPTRLTYRLKECAGELNGATGPTSASWWETPAGDLVFGATLWMLATNS